MKLIFEHIVVNGYIIDVYGSVHYTELFDKLYYVSPDEMIVTKNGYPIDWFAFIKNKNNEELFWQTLGDTEKQYQQYLMEIYNGY